MLERWKSSDLDGLRRPPAGCLSSAALGMRGGGTGGGGGELASPSETLKTKAIADSVCKEVEPSPQIALVLNLPPAEPSIPALLKPGCSQSVRRNPGRHVLRIEVVYRFVECLSAARQRHQTAFGLYPILGGQSLQNRRELSRQRFAKQLGELAVLAQLELTLLSLHEALPGGCFFGFLSLPVLLALQRERLLPDGGDPGGSEPYTASCPGSLPFTPPRAILPLLMRPFLCMSIQHHKQPSLTLLWPRKRSAPELLFTGLGKAASAPVTDIRLSY